MAALTGNAVQDTYPCLLKTDDNGILTGSLKRITDGAGNNSALSLSTGAAKITGTLEVSSIAANATNPNKYLVGNSGVLEYRTFTQIKADMSLNLVDNTSDANKPVSTSQATAIGVVQTDINNHEALTNNPHSVTKTQVGLGNADNTSDANKPVSTAGQTALDLKVDKNAAITGATKTKITYDAKGLVTSGADATTADIADSSNKRYVTDADLVDIGNLSGTNTGDQSSIVGITGTKAQFNTAVSDGNILYVGDALSNTGTGLIENISLQDEGTSIAAKTYTIELYAQFAYTINELKIISGLGTCTANLKINTTSVTGISAIAVSTSIATGTASAANVVAVGDKITLVITSTSTLDNLQLSIKITRS